MAYYTELKFDAEYFINTFNNCCKVAHAVALVETVSSLNGDDTWINPYYQEINEQYATISTDSIKAFVKIFGSGKSMAGESDNPFLKDYKQSDAWNPSRPNDGTVMYRPKSYKGLDWEHDLNRLVERQGSGKTGEYKGFQDTKPDFKKLTKVLELYKDRFYKNLNEEFMEKMNDFGKFFVQYSHRNKV